MARLVFGVRCITPGKSAWLKSFPDAGVNNRFWAPDAEFNVTAFWLMAIKVAGPRT